MNKNNRLYLLPSILFVLLLVLFFFFRFYLVEREEGRRVALAKVVAHQIGTTLEMFSADRSRALNNLIISWPDRYPNPVDWFHTHAASMKNVLPGIDDIWWLNPDFTVRWNISSENRSGLLGKPVTDFGINGEVLFQKGKATSLTDLNKLLNLYVLRVDPNNLSLGYVVASFDIKTTLEAMLGDLIGPQFNFSLYDGTTKLLDYGVLVDDGSIVSMPVIFAERKWSLRLQSSQQMALMGNLILVGGALMSALICLFLFWQLRSAIRLSQSQLHYQAASEAALDSIMVYEAVCDGYDEIVDFKLVDANKVTTTLFGKDMLKQGSLSLNKHLEKMNGKDIFSKIKKVNENGHPFECVLSRHKLNEKQWLKLQIVKAGIGIAMTVRDITQRHLSQQKLEQSEAKFRRLIDGLHGHFIYSIKANGEVTYISHGVKDILGYEASDFKHNNQNYIKNMPNNMAEIRRRQLQGDGTEAYLVSYIAASKEEVIIEYTDSPIFDKDHNLVAIEGIGRDVTADIQLREKIYYQANHDQLTGLLNRYAFDRKLQKVLNKILTQQDTATLCYIDMDQFKLVNDTCGHQAGDKLLRNIANILGKTLKDKDILARVGGDEFCLVLHNTNSHQAETRVQELLDNVANFRFLWDDKVFHVGASVGIVQIDHHYTEAVGLVKAADTACYTAKNNGRNQYHLHQQGDNELAFRNAELDTLAHIQHALEYGRFELYFQTIKPLSDTHKRFNYEILLRMKDKNGQVISPAMFIPVAERHGLMTRVDQWVFERTLDLLESHSEHVQHLEKCAINLSGVSLNSPSLLTKILNRLKVSTIPVEKLCFEITETSAVMNLVNADNMVNEIRALGCKFALDDFGAGMSSFTYLKNMSVDFVKIDGSFVKNMCNDVCDLATVKAIHDIATSMGKQTIAEFVGDAKTEQRLKDMGINYAQGYAIGKPQPFMDMLNLRSLSLVRVN
ncbi:EAL domain-containing protein [uncultured Paraglaciecola sp.]|uniref:bifunctional diguanylate cyclase/phosphodiesterase n=1 Tax=uncultured Paraglaciecola sp. TaxID=1765024 RepID=UPI0030DA8066